MSTQSLQSKLQVSASIILAIIVLFLVVWRIPIAQTQGVELSEGETRFDVENSARETLVQALGGLFFCTTTFFTWRTLINAEKNFQLSEDKLVTERFGKSIEMLAHEKTEVRIGGIYLLERISRDSIEDYRPVLETLCAFIRIQSVSYRQMNENENITPQDIQSALEVLVNRNVNNDGQLKLNLRQAWLRNSHLSGIHLDLADLQGADLKGADLKGASLDFSNLKGANLDGASLEFASIKSVKWDNNTVWPSSNHMKNVRNIPTQLSEKLGWGTQSD